MHQNGLTRTMKLSMNGEDVEVQYGMGLLQKVAEHFQVMNLEDVRDLQIKQYLLEKLQKAEKLME